MLYGCDLELVFPNFFFLVAQGTRSCPEQRTLGFIRDWVVPSPGARAPSLAGAGQSSATPISRLQEGNY